MSLTNFDIPDDLKVAFKVKAAKNKTSMSAVLIDFIKYYVGEKNRKRA
jgi:plasmid stability protein